MPYECIDMNQAKQLIKEENALVIDIRDEAAYAAGHIENAEHVQNTSIQSFLESADSSRPLIVCCYHGNMSKGAAEYFQSMGFSRSYSLDGGYHEWAQNHS